MTEALAGLDTGDLELVGHYVVHGVLHRLDSVMGRPAGLPLNHAPHAEVQRVEVWRARWPYVRGPVPVDVVGKPVLRHLGDVGRGRILLEGIWPSLGNSVHPGLHGVLPYLDILAGVHSEASIEEERRHVVSFTGYYSQHHESGREFGVHHYGYLIGILA